MTNHLITIVCLTAVLPIVHASQVTLTEPSYQQNFNGLPTQFGLTEDLPFPESTVEGPSIFLPGWTNSLIDYAPGGIYSNTQSYNNQNSNRAFRDGASDDYAYGTRNAAPVNITLGLYNASGADWEGFTVGYTVEQYSAGPSGAIISFSYSTDGGTFVTVGMTGADIVNAVTADTAQNLSKVQETERMANVGVTVAQNTTLWLRWTYTPAGASNNAHMAIDDVSFSAVPEPALVGSVIAALLAGLTLRRRR